MAITQGYQRLLREQRARQPTWGNAKRHAAPVALELKLLGIESGTVLDFGAGTGAFKQVFEELTERRFEVDNYEPGHLQWAELKPWLYDAVVCTHVLEHVEPPLLAETLDEIRTHAKALIYIEVPHGPATKILPDGRDAHLTQQPPPWWYELLTLRLWPFTIESRPAPNSLNTQFIGRL